VTGSIKFDIELPAAVVEQASALRPELIGDRPVWIAASTHEGEEPRLLDAHRKLLQRFPNLLLILVPRHPERFLEVRALIERSGFETVSRTEDRPCPASTTVFFGDTMGEVPLFYGMSDIAFVGGSLVPVGGHNLLEPAAQGLPIVTGSHLFNAQDIADMFLAARASRMVNDGDELVDVITELLTNPEIADTLGKNGLALLKANRGALDRLLILLEPLLAERLA
jgi:3-deoxy-D-manno-octulosonic-acid transferase